MGFVSGMCLVKSIGMLTDNKLQLNCLLNSRPEQGMQQESL